jgi:hypothetical protein
MALDGPRQCLWIGCGRVPLLEHDTEVAQIEGLLARDALGGSDRIEQPSARRVEVRCVLPCRLAAFQEAPRPPR